jgi:putative thioredoxin
LLHARRWPNLRGMADTPFVIDVGDRDFEREVLDRSREVPVVVDFWAPWCAPCRALGPLLERLAAEHAGAFVLAKVNVDESPAIAQAFAIQGIPAVKGFREGAQVAEFVGAQPEAAVRQFLAAVLPTEADRLARQGEAIAAAGAREQAEAAFEAALAREPRHARALLGRARLHADAGRDAEALQLVERVSPASAVAREAERLAAELRTRLDGTGDEAGLRGRVGSAPDDLEARLALGRLLAAQRRYVEALAELLEVVRRDPRFADEAARKTMIDVFEILGPQHPLTDRYRSELAKALFR